MHSWVGTAQSCTGPAWWDVEQVGSFALVNDSGLGPEFEPEHGLGLGPELPGSSFVVGVSGPNTACLNLDVQLAFERVREAVAPVEGGAG